MMMLGGAAGAGGGGGGGRGRGGDATRLLHQMSSAAEMVAGGARVPQWGQQETRELIAIRGEMEREFSVAGVSKRSSNKTMWEAVAARMSERGFRRTPDQCKCKWKNLVNRYKGKETSDPENGRQCPFFDELHAVFTERARNMQRQLLQSESGGSSNIMKQKLKRSTVDQSSYELSADDADDDVDDDVSDDDNKKTKKRKAAEDSGSQRRQTRSNLGASSSGIGLSGNSVQELVQGFLQQQQLMEVQWREMMERRARERLVYEQGWRESMQKLERERLMLEQAWMEREEQRRVREETRAERRDHLLTTLLNKLLQDDL